MIGTTLSHYTVTDRLGEGGMGVVYRAIDSRLNRTVALKVITSDAVADPDRKRRFVREARAASALNHPNIVTIHDIDEAGGVDFLVMELVQGRTLERLIPAEGLPVGIAMDHAAAIASALEAAHAADIVHRDIKPANIMVSDAGVIKVLDFGIAKLLDRDGDPGAPTVAATGRTELGVVVGTLRYMSPEQAQGESVDARSDIFSFGAVLYEMLAGRPAFSADNTMKTLAALLSEAPPPIDARRRDLPRDLVRLVQRCLEKDRAARPSAHDLVVALAALSASDTSRSVPLSTLVRRRGVMIPALAVLVAAAAGGGFWWNAHARVRSARGLIPEIQRHADRDDYDGAYRLGREAIAILPDDPQLKQLWLDTTGMPSFQSEPPGADIQVKGYLADDAPWISLGRTPLANARTPFGLVRIRVTKEGYGPIEAARASVTGEQRYVLDPVGSIPAGMVRVKGEAQRVAGSTAPLDDYWIDRFEVMNREFKTFVDRGGYRTREYWKEPFVDRGRTLTWDEAMAAFRDPTGRAGPATWELGTFPAGQADFPVAGVSWYEAAAYAVFAGKNLPTAFHWRRAAGYGDFFFDMPLLSNFAGKGPAAAGAFRGLGAYGTYDMAGNVKEWCWNEATGGRMILGGGWNDPNYSFDDPDAQPPMDRLETYGFRLARYITPPAAQAFNAIEKPARDYAKEAPVSNAEFDVFSRSLYRYDPTTNVHAVVEGREEATDWVKETVAFDAPYGGERIRAYLYMPKNAAPPYQTIVYFPGGDAPFLRSSRDLRLRWVDFIIRSGRALLYPVYKGTYERGVPVTGINGYRDLVISRVKDVSRSVDYLRTRQDIDKGRIGFYGISLGATTGIVATAVEPRFKASVLMGGGLWISPGPSEIDPLNFAPRIRVPTLMVNGRADFSYPYDGSQLPLFRLIGTPADQKSHVTFEGGHIPLRIHDVIKVILEWYNRSLGPLSTTG